MCFTEIPVKHQYTTLYWLFTNFTHGNMLILQCMRPGFDSWVRKFPWRKKWQPTPVFLPGEAHGQRSLAGYGPRDCKSQTQLRD